MASEDTKKKGKKEEEDTTFSGFQPDTFSMKQLRKINERVFQILGQDPDIQELFDKAYAGDYAGVNGKQRFWDDMENMSWWSNNSSALRLYIIQSADPENKDFELLRQDAYENVRKTAMQLGMNLSTEQITETAEKVLMYGWGQPGQEYRLRDEIMQLEPQGQYGGDILANAESLRAVAAANGIYYNDQWFDSAGKSIASEASTYEEWESEIRQKAMEKYPVFAQQIQAGQTVRSVASPYLQAMSQVLELNPEAISLDDPTLLGAMTNFDDKGNPVAIGLGDFMRQLRDDPRWINTDQAQNEITSISGRVMQMFGLMGR